MKIYFAERWILQWMRITAATQTSDMDLSQIKSQLCLLIRVDKWLQVLICMTETLKAARQKDRKTEMERVYAGKAMEAMEE